MVSVLMVIDVARFHEKSALLESPEIYQDLVKDVSRFDESQFFKDFRSRH